MDYFTKINQIYVCNKCKIKKYKRIKKNNGDILHYISKHINNCNGKTHKKKRVKPGMKCESEFICNLQKFKGTIINKNILQLLQNNDIKFIKENDMLIDVKGCGTKRDENNNKKSDVKLIFKSGKTIGISYKMDNAWAICSWMTFENGIKILGEKNFSNVTNDIPNRIKGNNNKLYLGINIHLCNRNGKGYIQMTKYDKNFNIFSSYFDRHTKLLYSGTKSNFDTFEDFLKSDKLQSQREVIEDKTKQLYIMYRYIYTDTTKSNNGAHLLSYFKFDRKKIDQIKNKHFNNTEELLKYGSFVPYSKRMAEKVGGKLNTRNLLKYYKNKYNITFNNKK